MLIVGTGLVLVRDLRYYDTVRERGCYLFYALGNKRIVGDDGEVPDKQIKFRSFLF